MSCTPHIFLFDVKHMPHYTQMTLKSVYAKKVRFDDDTVMPIRMWDKVKCLGHKIMWRRHKISYTHIKPMSIDWNTFLTVYYLMLLGIDFAKSWAQINIKTNYCNRKLHLLHFDLAKCLLQLFGIVNNLFQLCYCNSRLNTHLQKWLYDIIFYFVPRTWFTVI